MLPGGKLPIIRIVPLVNRVGSTTIGTGGYLVERRLRPAHPAILGSHSVEEPLKHLMQELGNAINDSLSESDRIAEAIGEIKKAGYDVFLVLEATIGFNRREESSESDEEEELRGDAEEPKRNFRSHRQNQVHLPGSPLPARAENRSGRRKSLSALARFRLVTPFHKS